MSFERIFVQYDIFSTFQRQISICSEEILEIETFLDSTGGMGLAILSTSKAFSVLRVYDDATKIVEFGELTNQLPECWTVVNRRERNFLLVCSGTTLFIAPVDRSSPTEQVEGHVQK